MTGPSGFIWFSLGDLSTTEYVGAASQLRPTPSRWAIRPEDS